MCDFDVAHPSSYCIMSSLFWIVRLTVVLFFLVMFLRRPNHAWAVGLLASCGVVLLDVLRGRGLLTEAGFLASFFSGVVAAAAFFWLTSLAERVRGTPIPSLHSHDPRLLRMAGGDVPQSVADFSYDRKQLYDQIRTNLSGDDVFDLIHDLELNENDVINPALDMPQIIVRIIDLAEKQGKAGVLAHTVERILTPLPAENLPRLERLSAETPAHLLRQFLVANYNLEQLQTIATKIGVNWEELGSDSKKSRVRRLLWQLRRRNQLSNLFKVLQDGV